MKKMSSNCKFYMRILLSVYLLGSQLCSAETTKRISRMPANFVPDDDMIIVPIIIERNFYNEFNTKHKREFSSAKKKIQHWLRQEQYAKDYGLEDTGIVVLPTEEEKQRFLQKHYLRFISKDVERSTNKSLQNSWDDWTADDEIDAISALELHEKVIVTAKKRKGAKDLKASREVKIGKDKLKVGVQVRPEIGMVNFTLRSKYFKARAWVGINGNQELKIEKRFKSTNTRAFVNYYIEETRLLAAIDQKLSAHWTLRLTHAKDFDDFEQVNETIVSEDNITQLRYSIPF